MYRERRTLVKVNQSSYHCGQLELKTSRETWGNTIESMLQSYLIQGLRSWDIYTSTPISHWLKTLGNINSSAPLVC